MTLQQLRYIVEIDRTRSITWAADSLYMSQPNLSRSIKELEEKLGFEIFRRSSQGMTPTREGGEIVARAKKILSQVDAIEEIGTRKQQRRQSFGVSVSRLSYAAIAFRRFMDSLDLTRPVNIDYCEAGVRYAMENVVEQRHNLAVISYDSKYEQEVITTLEAEGLAHEELYSSSALVLLSGKNPLALREVIDLESLSGLIQVQYDEGFGIGRKAAPRDDAIDDDIRRVTVHCRSSFIDLIAGESRTYGWSPPLPNEVLERHGLVQLHCSAPIRSYTDLVIWRDTYTLSSLDRDFIYQMHNVLRLIT